MITLNKWKLIISILFMVVVVFTISVSSSILRTNNQNNQLVGTPTQPTPLIRVVHIPPKPLTQPLTQKPYIVLSSPKMNDTFTEGDFINISGKIVGRTDYGKKITVALWWGWGGIYKHIAGAVNQQEYPINSDGTFKVKLEIPKGSLAKTKRAQFDLNVSYPGSTSANIAIEHVSKS